MLLIILFIIYSSVCRGLLNYRIFNGILSILNIIGILLSNYLLFILGSFGKIGYSPFVSILLFIRYCSSYFFAAFDLINKWAYFGSFSVISNFWDSSFFEFWFLIMNLGLNIFFIRLIFSIKQSIFISSIHSFGLFLLLILVDNYLFAFSSFIFYSITTIWIILLFIEIGILVDLSFSIFMSFEDNRNIVVNNPISIACVVVAKGWLGIL